MSVPFQRIIASHLEFDTPADESTFFQYVFGTIDHYRRIMGFERDNCFRAGSFLHKLDIWQKKSEQDYTYRASTDPLFKESNIAANAILTQISQQSDKISNDLLNTPAFFTTKSQGSEDQSQGIDIFKERLLFRSKKSALHQVCQFAAKGALTRGQEIILTTYDANAYLRPTLISVIKVDGKVVKDSLNQPVLDSDVWIPNPANPDETILEKELDLPNKVRYPADVIFITENPKIIKAYTQDDPGASSKVIHYGDFFTVLNAAELKGAELNGHVFRANVGDLMNGWPEESRLPAAKEYMEAAKNCTLPESNLLDGTVTADAPILRNGEDEDIGLTKANTYSNPRGANKRSFYYGVIRYDVDNDGYLEDVYFVADVASRRILHYEYASIIFSWDSSEHPLPYTCLRIWPRAHRWYGMGQYELLEAFETIEDRNINRIEIDSATSGNFIFEDPTATTAGIDGDGLQPRSREAYELRTSRTAQEALQVITIKPEGLDIFAAQAESARARIELTGGTTSPQDSTTTDIPGSDTLGVAKILENTANISLRAREAEIVTGITAVLRLTAAIEKWSAMQPGNMPFLAKQLGEEKAALLVEWLATTSDDLMDIIEVNLSKSSSTQLIEISRAILDVIDRWMMTNPMMLETIKPIYENILTGLDVANPDQLLNIEAVMAAQQQMAEAAAQQESAKNQEAPPPP